MKERGRSITDQRFFTTNKMEGAEHVEERVRQEEITGLK